MIPSRPPGSRKLEAARRLEKVQSDFHVAAGKFNLTQMQALIDQGQVKPSTYRGAFQWLCQYGFMPGVRLLLPLVNPKADSCRALANAAENGCAEIVALLLPLSDPTINQSTPMRAAARCGHFKIVEMLLPHANPGDATQALIDAFAGNSKRAPPAIADRDRTISLLAPHANLSKAVDWLVQRNRADHLDALDAACVMAHNASGCELSWAQDPKILSQCLPRVYALWQARQLEQSLPVSCGERASPRL